MWIKQGFGTPACISTISDTKWLIHALYLSQSLNTNLSKLVQKRLIM